MGRKKKNNTSEAESCYPNVILPEEIVVEILSRLSLRSLTRLTYVSKQWHSLISTICATKTGPPKVLLVSKSRAYSFLPHSINRYNRAYVESVHVPWDVKEREKYSNSQSRFGILGSCNGLLLMCIDEDLFLWNPLTRVFKKVLSYFRLCDLGYRICSGLCYDSISDEYKAVLALAHQTPSYGGEFVVVGSFRSKSWTRIDDIPYMVPSMDSGPIVNGNLHWFASKKGSSSRFLGPHQIINFNARADKFEEVPMPEHKGEDGDIICGLGVLNGYLCMFRSMCPGDSESNVEVLMMKEYGVKNSWTIRFVISHGFTCNHYDRLVLLGYAKNGELITDLRKYYRWHIRAFNLTDNSHRIISIPEDTKTRYSCAIAYEESLITPPDYDWEEDEQKEEATYMVYDYHTWKMKKDKDGYWTTEHIELDT